MSQCLVSRLASRVSVAWWRALIQSVASHVIWFEYGISEVAMSESGSESLVEKLSKQYGETAMRRPSPPPAKLSKARDLLAGREEEVLNAVDLFGIRKVVEVLSEEGIILSRATLCRICNEIRNNGFVRTRGWNNPPVCVEGYDAQPQSEGDSADKERSHNHREGPSEKKEVGCGVEVLGAKNPRATITEVENNKGKSREEISRSILKKIMDDSFGRV